MEAASTHRGFMQQALQLAARARGRTSPNPNVGAVLVKDGQIIGRGWTAPPGGPHAEIVALGQAREHARGATLYVTLEPCAHFGRTPPCCRAVAEAGVARVFAATTDPNPAVDGAGLRFLSERGIETHTGLLETEARDAIGPFLKRVKTGLPFVELKVAMTLDGKIATASGKSRWITGEAAREWVHRRRDWADAVMVGANTVRADDPQLTVRLPDCSEGRQPLRVTVSASGNLDPGARIFHGPPPGAIVFSEAPLPDGFADVAHSEHEGPAVQAPALWTSDQAAVEWVRLTDRDEPDQLRDAFCQLAQRGVNDVLVEGGAGLAAALLRAGLVDRLSVFLAPKLFGGQDAAGGFGDLLVRDPAGALNLRDMNVEKVGDDWLFQGTPTWPRDKE